MGASSTAALAVALGADAALAVAVGGVVGVIALSRWRPTQPVVVALAGVAALGAGEGPTALAAVLVGGAAWLPAQRRLPGPEFSPVVLSAILTFATIALSLLTVGQFTELSDVAVALAIVTVLTGMARAGLTVVERLRESRHQAQTDDLTGLGNRRYLVDRLDAAVDWCAEEGEEMALLLVDLDGFKELNDTLGHDAGEQAAGGDGPSACARCCARRIWWRGSGATNSRGCSCPACRDTGGGVGPLAAHPRPDAPAVRLSRNRTVIIRTGASASPSIPTTIGRRDGAVEGRRHGALFGEGGGAQPGGRSSTRRRCGRERRSSGESASPARSTAGARPRRDRSPLPAEGLSGDGRGSTASRRSPAGATRSEGFSAPVTRSGRAVRGESRAVVGVRRMHDPRGGSPICASGRRRGVPALRVAVNLSARALPASADLAGRAAQECSPRRTSAPICSEVEITESVVFGPGADLVEADAPGSSTWPG